MMIMTGWQNWFLIQTLHFTSKWIEYIVFGNMKQDFKLH
uniref:Uncharacterized protein n=1 Tax=Rhizophora mucronata TaxID=61149 RepID=A0A2P2PWF8_RHIMU